MINKYALCNIIGYVKQLSSSCKFDITFKGSDTNYFYIFEVFENNVSLMVQDSNKNELELSTVKDTDNLQLEDSYVIPKNFTTSTFQPNGDLFRSEIQNIVETHQLYIQLFKSMRDRVSFIFKSDDRYFNCYYVDGKVLYLEETEDTLKLMGTNLIRLNDEFPNYEIVAFSNSIHKNKYGMYVGEIRNLANIKGKKLEKYLFGVLQRGDN